MISGPSIWEDTPNRACKRCDDGSPNMTQCYKCTNSYTCIECYSTYYLDTVNKNCLTDCSYDSNCNFILLRFPQIFSLKHILIKKYYNVIH